MTTSGQRILFVTPSLGGGGAEKQLLYIANGAAQSGFNTSVFCFRDGGAYGEQLDPSVKRYVSKVSRQSSFKGTVFGLPQLRKCITAFQPHLIVSFLNHMSIASWLLARPLTSCKRCICIQNNFEEEVNGALGRLGSRAFKYLMQRACSSAAGIVYISKGVQEGFQRSIATSGTPSVVIYNIAGLEKPSDRLLQEQETCQLIDDERVADIPLIVACGRMHPQKDYPTLLSAFRLVRNRMQCRLDVLGTGPLLEDLQKLTRSLGIENDVKFLGFQGKPERYMQRGRVFAISSRFEGFGNVIVEAMSLGVPVVSTDCPYGPGEVITDKCNGLLVPVGDVEALAKAIADVISDEELAKRLSVNGQLRAKDFEKEKIIPKYLGFFNQILNG